DRAYLPIHFVVLLVVPRPARSTLFPYTTLFRSRGTLGLQSGGEDSTAALCDAGHVRALFVQCLRQAGGRFRLRQRRPGAIAQARSEEHTSELQSRENLVCRLLLEKKNEKKIECQ